MKNKKFNHGSFGNTHAYFPIKQHRYDTRLHPVHLSDEKCSAKIQLVLSHQESQMVEGLTNILGTKEREAVRIACHEAATSVHKDAGNYLPYGSSSSRKRGHTGRNTKLALKLPNEEKKLIIEAAQELGCTEKELVRTAIIWLAKKIRDQDYNEITDSHRIGQDKLAKEWRKDNLKTKGKLQALRLAHEVAYEEARKLGEAVDKERQLAREAMVMEMGSTIRAYKHDDDDEEGGDWTVVDAMIEIEQQEKVEKETEGMNRDQLIEYWTDKYFIEMNMEWEDAKAMADEWVKTQEEAALSEAAEEWLEQLQKEKEEAFKETP